MPGHPVDPSVFHALVLLNLLFVTGAWCLARPTYRAAAVLAFLSVAWLFGNGPIEGRVLVTITVDHGFTESDILSIIGVGIAAITFTKTRERRRYDE
ncbi:hypothetical protein RVF83_11020 [Gordonia rubripertincta]|uniref:Uncharacterized protein n=2 Tax=Gordonia rubripertincta TaxID=36822 RepID=A0AAW6RKV7_GORRU|nr:hypothetical protein [Gordonia rubripertincta]MDG6783829.1 hypothetical protein [Gordonia rubripertincta]NKY66088.1 hypothetical protein [Gordonia rubripertincta]GAB84223.1 hypothetical protein GORBP_036_00020 [Gordonia rubripertincta NBRC 101908]